MEVSSFQDVFKANGLPIAKIKNEMGIMSARAILVILISQDLLSAFNVGKGMNDTQVAILADDMIELFYYFTIEDFKLCFKRARRNEKVFDRLDPNVVIAWLKAYEAERVMMAERISMEEAKTITEANGATYEGYLHQLQENARNGDKNASEALKNALGVQSVLKKIKPIKKPSWYKGS